MKIVLAIPSGDRTEQLLKVIARWRKVAPDFKIALYTWDKETTKFASKFVDYNFNGDLQSFAKNQNLMAKAIDDWDVWICGADDLYPESGIDLIEKVCTENPGKIIWVKDGCFNQQPTHPIITRGWYDKHGEIFDEQFEHNFCDTDLLYRASVNDEIVKCFDIGFDHRHYLKTGRKPDKIYKLGQSSFARDKKRFEAKQGVSVG